MQSFLCGDMELDSYYCELEADALLHLTGPDSQAFLQGQTSCDSSAVSAQTAVEGVYCTPQGRVVCDFLLCQLDDNHFGLRMRRALRKTAAETFGKYIIFSKAELDAERDDWSCFALWGDTAEACVVALAGRAPGAALSCVETPSALWVQRDEAAQQFECYVRPDQSEALRAELEQHLTRGSEADWQALQIIAGRARIEPTLGEALVPQTLNYDLTGHINFKKGCYTGQEVVARLHYRGTPKRRTHIATTSLEQPPSAGTPVYCAGKEQSVGTIINSAAQGPGSIVLVATTEQGVEEGLHLESPNGPALTLGTLPYAISASD